MPMNTQLLRRAQRKIASRQIVDLEGDDKFSIEWWIVVAAGLNPEEISDLYTEARKLLRISKRQADQIFIANPGWPVRFSRRAVDACSPRQVRSNARVTAERFDYFIRRGR